MKYSEVVQLERLLEKYRDTYANSKARKNKIDSLAKIINKKAEELKDSGYRFFVCKQARGEDVPVAGPFLTKKDTDQWMLNHGEEIQETLYGVRARKDMWDEEDIERTA